MKFFRLSWVTTVNVLLIILPWLIFGTFVYHYGQPVLYFYRNYFLGNPIRELNEFTRDLAKTSRRAIRFRRLNERYKGIIRTRTYNDTQLAQLRVATIQVHHAVVRRFSGDLTRAKFESLSDSYSNFLTNEANQQLFVRHEEVRDDLIADLKRLYQVLNYPNHPAKGLEVYGNTLDEAVSVIKQYGEIYADEVRCRETFQMSCGRVFDPSVHFAAKRLNQYFRSWPEFSRTMPASGEQFAEKFKKLVPRFTRGIEQLEAYLTNQPWRRFETTRKSIRNFNDFFHSQFREWYRLVVNGIRISPELVSVEQWSNAYKPLNNFRLIESALNKNTTMKNFLLNEKIRKLRQKFRDQLIDTYRTARTMAMFNSEFSVSKEGLNSLEQTIATFPQGDEQLAREKNLLKSVEDIQAELQSHLESRKYGSLLRSLREIKKKLDTETAQTWSVMLRTFLEQTRDRVTSPSLQPRESSKIDDYQKLIQLYVELGKRLKIPGIDQEWRRRTFLVLKSRQFNQLKYKLLNLLKHLKQDDMDQIRGLLSNFLALKNLPDELRKRTRQILFQTALIEFIELGDRSLYEKYESRFTNRPVRRRLWNQINQLMVPIKNFSPRERFRRLKFPTYIEQIKSWLKEFERGGTLEDYTRQALVRRVNHMFKENEDYLVDRISEKWLENTERQQMMTWAQKLNSASQVLDSKSPLDTSLQVNRWIELLKVRTNLTQIRSLIESIKRGSVFNTNEQYTQYRNLTRNLTIGKLPEDYNYDLERSYLVSLHQSVLNRARTIHEQSQDDWISGWGGQVEAIDLLNNWENLLKTILNKVPDPRLRGKIQELLDFTRRRQEDWA